MSARNPFRITSSRSVYENNWIQVEEHGFVNPAGSPGIYGVVRFKNRAVGVVPYHEGRIWLVGQYRFPLQHYSWEIPEGGSPESEALEETARRELREETGIEAASFEKIVEMHLSNSVTNEYGIVFLARGLTFGEAEPEDTEELQVKTVTLEDAYAQVKAGEITDSLSVAAILRLKLMDYEGSLE